MRGFWNYFRRRRLAEEIEAERAQWDQAVTLVTDLSDDRTNLEETPPPEFAGISVDGRRVVNTAVIAYAQQLVAALVGWRSRDAGEGNDGEAPVRRALRQSRRSAPG